MSRITAIIAIQLMAWMCSVSSLHIANVNTIQDDPAGLPPANEMADKILQGVATALDTYLGYYATIPGFWKDFIADNSTLLNRVVAGEAKFCAIGTISRSGEASYESDSGFTTLNFAFSVDSITANYTDVLYISNWAKYQIAETVLTPRLRVQESVTFNVPTMAECSDASLSMNSECQSGGVKIDTLTPGTPQDVLTHMNSVLTDGFLQRLSGATEDLFIAATSTALQALCPPPS